MDFSLDEEIQLKSLVWLLPVVSRNSHLNIELDKTNRTYLDMAEYCTLASLCNCQSNSCRQTGVQDWSKSVDVTEYHPHRSCYKTRSWRME